MLLRRRNYIYILRGTDVTLSNEFASYYYTVRHNKNKLKKTVDLATINQKIQEAKEKQT